MDRYSEKLRYEKRVELAGRVEAFSEEAKDYSENLSDEQLADIEAVISKDVLPLLIKSPVPAEAEVIAKRVDKTIKSMPGIAKALTLYRSITDGEELRKGGELVDPSFFAGTTSKPKESKDVVILEVSIPSGAPVLQLSGDLYLLPRGLTLLLKPIETGPILATVKGGLTASGEMFHDGGGHNQKSHGGTGGGGGSRKGKLTPTGGKNKTFVRAAKIAAVAAVVTAALAVVAMGSLAYMMGAAVRGTSNPIKLWKQRH